MAKGVNYAQEHACEDSKKRYGAYLVFAGEALIYVNHNQWETESYIRHKHEDDWMDLRVELWVGVKCCPQTLEAHTTICICNAHRIQNEA